METTLLYGVALQLGLATLAGGLIGIQRAASGKVAGVRTHILICVGSAMFMQISSAIVPEDPARWSDPGRIASQVVVGVGFLGAGSIIRSGFTVAGLTSAATIWLVAALGLASGAGLYIHLLVGTIFSLLTLHLLPRFMFTSLSAWRSFNVVMRTEQALTDLRTRLEDDGAQLRLAGFRRADDGTLGADMMIKWSADRVRRLEDELLRDADVLACKTSRSR